MNLTDLFINSDKLVDFKSGTTIFAEGSEGDCMYILMEGEVEIRVDNQLIDVLKSGSIFGEMALIDSSPRSAAAIAASDCKLAVVDYDNFLFMIRQTPFFALEVMRIMAGRLRQMNSMLLK